MSELEESSEIGGGRASVDSLSEYLKEFKSARMSFEPLDTWLFVKNHDDSSNDIESVSDSNDVSAASESDSSVLYHFDSDEVSTGDSDDADDASAIISPGATSVYAVEDYDKGCDKGKTLIVRNLANSPGRSGNGIKVFSEADQSDILEECYCTSPDVSLDYNSCLKNSVESVHKYVTECHQPSVNSPFSVNPAACRYNTYEAYDDHVLVTTDHQNVRTSEYCRDICSDCDILEKFESSSKKPAEVATNTSPVSHRHTNQSAINIESPTRTTCDDSMAECNTTDIDNDNASDTLKHKKKRQRIAQELMDTEATYQRHLELILQVYKLILSYFLIAHKFLHHFMLCYHTISL